jgi:hypothetical protein
VYFNASKEEIMAKKKLGEGDWAELLVLVEKADKALKKALPKPPKVKTKFRKSEDIPDGEMVWTRGTRESGLREYTCEHGCGHPDYVSAAKVAHHYSHPINVWLTHGCDGCCSRNDFPGHRPKPSKGKKT